MVASPSASPLLQIRLFGPFEVRLNGALLRPLRTRKGEWLLALLALKHRQPVDRSWLAGTLWLESDQPQGADNLRRALTDLRQALGSAAERLRSPTLHTLSLCLEGAEVDLLEFDQAMARGDAASLERGISVYRGPLLEGCVEGWALSERQVREQAYLAGLESLAQAALARGEHERAVEYLRRVVAVDPLRESAQRAIMQALAAGGSYAASLMTFRELRLLLHAQLHAEPDAETRALFEQIRIEARRSAADASAVRRPAPEPQKQQRLNDGDLADLTPDDLRLASRTLTFLFTDIEGSTHLWEQHPAAMPWALIHHEALLRGAIEAHGGQVFKTMGDAICAAFSTATDALCAALEGQRALQAEAWKDTGPLRVRMALHTGATQEREGDFFGPSLSRTARVLAVGHGGQILISQTASDMARDQLPEGVSLRDLGEHWLKGLARPERVFQLVSPDLPADFLPLETVEARPNNLPVQPTSLIGREREVVAARDLLQRDGIRLVTLTGPGGVGKTHLAVQVASDLLDSFRDGIFCVELAPIHDPALVASTIVHKLGVRRAEGQPLMESLKGYLQPRHALLLLDNFEQVMQATSLVAELLAAAPHLKVLITSREVLRLRGEKEFPVPPLAVPPVVEPASTAGLAPSDLTGYPATELFIQRALDLQPDFVVTAENALAVAAICHRLDGLPLAIELAAARIKLFPPRALLARLENRLELLSGGARDLPARQQTLRSAIAWSYELLEEREKTLFRRLGVFVGGFTLEAAAAVCNQTADLGPGVLDGIASLMDKSLLRRQESVSSSAADPGHSASARGEGEPRFAPLETIREFAWECLAASDESAFIRQQHAWYFLALAEANTWRLDRLAAERDNLRAALSWLVESADPEAFRYHKLAGDAASISLTIRETAGFYETAAQLIDRHPEPPLSTGERAAFFEALGHIRAEVGHTDAALAAYRAAQSEAGDNRVLWAQTQRDIAWLLFRKGHLSEAAASGREALDVMEAAGTEVDVADALRTLGMVETLSGHYQLAANYLDRALALYERSTDREGIALCCTYVAHLYHEQGDPESALAATQRQLSIYEELRQPVSIGKALNQVAYAYIRLNRHEEALPLLFRAADILERHHVYNALPHVYHSLAEALLSSGRLEEAGPYLERGLESARGIGEVRTVCNFHCLLARHEAAVGQVAAARLHYDEAIRVCADSHLEAQRAQILIQLGELLLHSGDPGEAARVCEEALTIRRRLGSGSVAEAETALNRARAALAAR